MRKWIDTLFPEPKPCPVCGETRIQTWFVSGYCGKFLPFWVDMQCPRCGRKTKPKLFRSRAVAQWNREAKIPKNCRECACSKGCKSWYGGLTCKHKGAIEGRVREWMEDLIGYMTAAVLWGLAASILFGGFDRR